MVLTSHFFILGGWDLSGCKWLGSVPSTSSGEDDASNIKPHKISTFNPVQYQAEFDHLRQKKANMSSWWFQPPLKKYHVFFDHKHPINKWPSGSQVLPLRGILTCISGSSLTTTPPGSKNTIARSLLSNTFGLRMGSKKWMLQWLIWITPHVFPSHFHGHEWKGSHNPIVLGLTITVVMNHLVNGMILQVAPMAPKKCRSGVNGLQNLRKTWEFVPFLLRQLERLLGFRGCKVDG